MASNGSAARVADTEGSLEKVKRQLTSGSGRFLLQGFLLKRSETLRKWNERWVILDPTTGKMEYKIRRTDPVVKGNIIFDSNSTITLSPLNFKVKDEELEYLAKDIRARESTIKDIADKLTETAQAAEAAAFAAHAMDEERRLACTKIEQLTKDNEKQTEAFQLKLKDSEEKAMNLRKERELLLKQRDSALQEAHMWRTELVKAREQGVLLEAAVLRAEERARMAEADAESRIRDAAEKVSIATKEKEELSALINVLQSQVQRQQSNTKQVCEERSESCSGTDGTLLLTKHADTSEDNVDKACMNDPRRSADRVIQLGVDGVEIHSIGEAQWSSSRSTEAGLSNVRDIPPEADGSMDILVIPDVDQQNRV